MLGAFYNTPARALEAEAAVLPPALQFEKQCDLYAIWALRFYKNHPVKQAITGGVWDELAEENALDSENNLVRYLRPITQLLALLSRL